MNISTTTDDKRCTVCSRFIPHGFTAKVSRGRAECVTHFPNAATYDKGGMARELPPGIRSRKQIKMEIV